VRSTPAPLPSVGKEERERSRERKRRKRRDRAVAGITRAAGGGMLAIGITEQNPNLVSAGKIVPPEFARWRDELGRLHPALYRLVIDWPSIQPRRRRRANLETINAGCVRAVGPCAAYLGVREQLEALASRQAQGGWEGVAVITGTPDWAGERRAGCLEGSGGARARPLSRRGLAAYRRLVRDVLAAAAEAGASLPWWSPWNEPNHPYFLAPQRTSCSGAAPSLAAGEYTRIARALNAALAAAPGEQRYVLGELAGLHLRSPKSTTIVEFIAALPRDLVCGTPVWSQHGYLEGRDQLADIEAALSAKGCGRRHAVWMTETGVGLARTGRGRGGDESLSCRRMHAQLRRWYRDARVTAAFQYTMREDNLFPTGLVTTDLTAAYPVLETWQAWGMTNRPTPTAAPPPAPDC
jgi:hypothetical protein